MAGDATSQRGVRPPTRETVHLSGLRREQFHGEICMTLSSVLLTSSIHSNRLGSLSDPDVSLLYSLGPTVSFIRHCALPLFDQETLCVLIFNTFVDSRSLPAIKALLISPNSSTAAAANLLQKTDCHDVIIGGGPVLVPRTGPSQLHRQNSHDLNSAWAS